MTNPRAAYLVALAAGAPPETVAQLAAVLAEAEAAAAAAAVRERDYRAIDVDVYGPAAWRCDCGTVGAGARCLHCHAPRKG